MTLRWFRDRPRPYAVRGIVYWKNAHLFFFHWGATLRWRRANDRWRHTTAFVRPRRDGTGKGFFFQVGTWATENGVTERIPMSKRYISVKTLFGSSPTEEEEDGS